MGFLETGNDSFDTVTLRVNDNTYGIDDVRSVSAASVPEPSTLVLRALGLLGVARTGRRPS